MGDHLGQVTEVLNNLVGSSLEILRAPPYKLKVRIARLTSRSTAFSSLPVVLSQRFEGPLRIWVALSLDLPTALSIADRALKASGSYAMGFSEIEQNILKDCFRRIGRQFLGGMKSLPGEFQSSSLRLTFGQRIATAPRTASSSLLAELGIPRAPIQIDLAVGKPLQVETWRTASAAGGKPAAVS